MLELRARPPRLERGTCWFEARRSIQLSYGRMQRERGLIATPRCSQESDVQAAVQEFSIDSRDTRCFPVLSGRSGVSVVQFVDQATVHHAVA